MWRCAGSNWCGKRGSNSQSPPWQGGALPITPLPRWSHRSDLNRLPSLSQRGALPDVLVTHWCGYRASNSESPAWKAGAMPITLQPRGALGRTRTFNPGIKSPSRYHCATRAPSSRQVGSPGGRRADTTTHTSFARLESMAKSELVRCKMKAPRRCLAWERFMLAVPVAPSRVGLVSGAWRSHRRIGLIRCDGRKAWRMHPTPPAEDVTRQAHGPAQAAIASLSQVPGCAPYRFHCRSSSGMSPRYQCLASYTGGRGFVKPPISPRITAPARRPCRSSSP